MDESRYAYVVQQVSPRGWLIVRVHATGRQILPMRYTAEDAAAFVAETLNGTSNREV